MKNTETKKTVTTRTTYACDFCSKRLNLIHKVCIICKADLCSKHASIDYRDYDEYYPEYLCPECSKIIYPVSEECQKIQEKSDNQQEFLMEEAKKKCLKNARKRKIKRRAKKKKVV